MTSDNHDSDSSDCITIEGRYLSVRLTGIGQVNAEEIVSSYKIDDEEKPLALPVVTFEIKNISDQLLEWRRDCLKFIDAEGYTYGPNSIYRVSESAIGSRWNCLGIELEPATRTKFVVAVEENPDGVPLEKIIYTLQVFEPGRTSGVVEDQERYEIEFDEAPSLSEDFQR